MSNPLKTLLVASLALAASTVVLEAQAAYSMSIKAEIPKKSAADAIKSNKQLPSATTYTPCDDEDEKRDALSFKITYDATEKGEKKGEIDTQNVYLILYNPNAKGALADNPPDTPSDTPPKCTLKTFDGKDTGLYTPCDPKVWALVRTAENFYQVALVPFAEVTDVNPKTHIYLSRDEILGGSITDPLLRSYVLFEGLSKGVWGLIGIIGDPDEVNFTKSTTWKAWDIDTFVLGDPWTHPEKGKTDNECKRG